LASAKLLATIERKRQEKFDKEHKMIDGVDHKFCNKHHIFFPEESPWIIATEEYFYHNDKNKTDGLHPECKKCGSKKAYINIVENYDRFKEDLKTYRQSEKGRKQEKEKHIRLKEKGTRKNWWQSHPDKLKVYNEKHRNHDILESEWKANQNILTLNVLIVVFPLKNI